MLRVERTEGHIAIQDILPRPMLYVKRIHLETALVAMCLRQSIIVHIASKMLDELVLNHHVHYM